MSCPDPECDWCRSAELALAAYPPDPGVWWSVLGTIAWLRHAPDGQLVAELLADC